MKKNLIATFPDGQKISSAVLSSYGTKLKELIAERIKEVNLSVLQERTSSIYYCYAEVVGTGTSTVPLQIAVMPESAVMQKTMAMYRAWVDKKLFVGPAALEYLMEIILTEIDKKIGKVSSAEELKEKISYSNFLLEKYQEKWSENKRCDNSYGEHAIRQTEEVVNWIFE